MGGTLSLKLRKLTGPILFFGGVLIFAYFGHLKSPWNYLSLLGVFLSGTVLIREIKSVKDFTAIFDVKRPSAYFYYFLVISVLFGLFWAILFRHYLNIELLPKRLLGFTPTAMAIGSVEEIIFRGYLQRELRKLGILISIFGASLMHTIYKCFLFLILPAIHPTDFFYLFIWTLGVGCISGALKEFSGNTMVPVSGHATFDLVVYGDGIVDRWWVWL